MISVRFFKRGSARFISHIDILRAVCRTIRRAELPVEFSKGFNPHMNLYFSPPAPLGIASAAEYFTADCSGVSAEEFLIRYNAAAPDCLMGIAAVESEKNPNFAANIAAASYVVPICGEKNDINKILGLPKSYKLSYTQNGESVEKDTEGKIFSINYFDGNLQLKLAAGANGLRIDRLLQAFERDFSVRSEITEVLRTEQYILENGVLRELF
ncbi:MAG TPA: TIGR03936 family radical SAM-associated protein [Eubacteriales bacterium]|jgi:radical SAM-linked protein|nr:TIGR03936 family radical SAM-associated protein [Clostridia bacterium]HRR89444.1 TIGR03936 family radical SAM-associated protein [Eubacteriales bacterium]HRU84804.1 TIGR03936 family radical SAM-associated protein [Eubacteriales bacterium]